MFRLLFNNFYLIGQFFYSPDDAVGNAGSETKEDEILDGKDEEEVKENDEEEDKEDEENDEDLELDTDEEDEENEEEKEIELKTPARKKAILKEYPDLFKKFPELESAYFSDQQYKEVFSTPREAKEAAKRVEIFNQIEHDVLDGNIKGILASVKESDPNALNKIADNYLETLFDVDNKAYFHVVGNLIKRTVVSMVRDARKRKNEDLEKAASELYGFVFPQDEEFKEPGRLSKEEDKDETVKKEREEFRRERLDTHVRDLSSRVDNTIKNLILNNIDKDNSMSDFVKKHATREAMEMLEDAIRNDSSFIRFQNGLWKESEEDKFSSSSLDKIKNSYLSKAKTLLKPIIKKARADALKGQGKTREDKDRKGPLPVNRNSTSSSNRGHNKGKEIPGNLSTKAAMDALLDG